VYLPVAMRTGDYYAATPGANLFGEASSPSISRRANEWQTSGATRHLGLRHPLRADSDRHTVNGRRFHGARAARRSKSSSMCRLGTGQPGWPIEGRPGAKGDVAASGIRPKQRSRRSRRRTIVRAFPKTPRRLHPRSRRALRWVRANKSDVVTAPVVSTLAREWRRCASVGGRRLQWSADRSIPETTDAVHILVTPPTAAGLVKSDGTRRT